MIYDDVELHNVEDAFPADDGNGTQLSRVPNEIRLSLNEMGRVCALGGAGSEIRFNLEGDRAKITLLCNLILKTWSPIAVAEVYQGAFMVSSHVVTAQPTTITVTRPQNIDLLKKVARERGLPFDSRLTRIILPIWPPTVLLDLTGDMSVPRPGQAPGERLLAYGSSITHGAYALRPTGTYPSRLSQMLGIDHLNLGLGGGAHCEGQLGNYIAKRSDWTMATLEIGINMVGNPDIDLEEFRRRVRYFVGGIAGQNEDKWVFCLDMFTFGPDLESLPGRHRKFRGIVRDEVQRLGLPRLVHVDGKRILRNPASLSLDLCHPSPQGMEEIAVNMRRVIGRSTQGKKG